MTSTRLDYCQYLLSTPINYTLTHFADRSTLRTSVMIRSPVIYQVIV